MMRFMKDSIEFAQEFVDQACMKLGLRAIKVLRLTARCKEYRECYAYYSPKPRMIRLRLEHYATKRKYAKRTLRSFLIHELVHAYGCWKHTEGFNETLKLFQGLL